LIPLVTQPHSAFTTSNGHAPHPHSAVSRNAALPQQHRARRPSAHTDAHASSINCFPTTSASLPPYCACNAPTGVKGQTLAKEGSTTREVDGELWQAGDHKGSLVRRWTSKLGRCLTRQSKGSCSEAVTEKAISDRPSTDLRTRGSTRNDESR